jgi:cobalt-zinc-cadmium efflux system outer membrane protein
MRTPLIVAAIAAAGLTGCQSHPRKPLDVAGHVAEYHARSVSAPAVAEFAASLNAATPGRITFDTADGLTLEEAEVVALVFSPELREARARAGVASASAANAGLWEDPMVDVSIERMLTSMGRPWTVMGGLGFTLPITGVPKYEKQMAEGGLTVELARAAAMEWEVRTALRKAWVEWSASRELVTVLEGRLAELDRLLERITLIVQAGEMQRVEAQMFRVEREMVSAELIRARGEASIREMMIRREMGLPAKAELILLPRLVVEATDEPVASTHPELVLAEAEYEMAERALELEVAMQFPSIGLGAGTGREEGNGLLTWGLTMPLPILNANREGLAKALASRELERIRCERMHEDLAIRAATAAATLRARRAEREAYEKGVVPMVDAQAADVERITAVGRVEPLMLMDSVSRRAEAKMRVIEARMEESLAAVELAASTYAGRPAQEQTR